MLGYDVPMEESLTTIEKEDMKQFALEFSKFKHIDLYDLMVDILNRPDIRHFKGIPLTDQAKSSMLAAIELWGIQPKRKAHRYKIKNRKVNK